MIRKCEDGTYAVDDAAIRIVVLFVLFVFNVVVEWKMDSNDNLRSLVQWLAWASIIGLLFELTQFEPPSTATPNVKDQERVLVRAGWSAMDTAPLDGRAVLLRLATAAGSPCRWSES